MQKEDTTINNVIELVTVRNDVKLTRIKVGGRSGVLKLGDDVMVQQFGECDVMMRRCENSAMLFSRLNFNAVMETTINLV